MAYDKEITIICVAYKRHAQIHVLIHSVLCQTLRNWKLHIIHDGYDAQMDEILGEYAQRYPEITFQFTEVRHDDYGHTLRELGIQAVDSEYVLITNDDNYYVPEFLRLMFNEIRTHQLDMVLCDMVHSHIEIVDGRLRYIKDQYRYFPTYPKKFMVDIGCFIVRTAMAQQVGFRDKSHAGDGTFVEDLMSKFYGIIKVGKLNKVLFVHN